MINGQFQSPWSEEWCKERVCCGEEATMYVYYDRMQAGLEGLGDEDSRFDLMARDNLVPKLSERV